MGNNANDYKNTLALGAFVLLLAAAFFIIYPRFSGEQEMAAVAAVRVTREQLNSKVLDLSALGDPRFTRMKKIEFAAPRIDSAEVGRSNPFAAPSGD